MYYSPLTRKASESDVNKGTSGIDPSAHVLASWQLAASGPWWSVLLKLSWRCEFRSAVIYRRLLVQAIYTLSNKGRTDRGIWSLLVSLRNQETWVLTLRGMISLRHAPSQRYEKIFFKFVTFYFKRDTSISVLELFPAIVFKKAYWL